MLGVGEGNEETRGMAKWAEVKHEDDDDEEETEAITEEECLFDQTISVRVCFYWLGGRSGRVKLSALYFLNFFIANCNADTAPGQHLRPLNSKT